MRGRRKTAAWAALAAAAFAGCGQDANGPPAACTEGAGPLLAALRAAPSAVRLRDGTRLSQCVESARQDGEIQTLGSLFTAAAHSLARAMPASDAAATRLGYLIAATRRGAGRTNGIHLELVRRLEQTIGIDGPPGARRRAFAEGQAAGRSLG